MAGLPVLRRLPELEPDLNIIAFARDEEDSYFHEIGESRDGVFHEPPRGLMRAREAAADAFLDESFEEVI